MDKDEFLRRLFLLFPPKTNPTVTLEFYLDALDSEQEYDYHELLKIVSREYPYKEPPTTNWLLDKRKLCKPQRMYRASTDEGKTIKRTLNGYEYEFVVVPNHWENVKTISELDREIEIRTKKVG